MEIHWEDEPAQPNINWVDDDQDTAKQTWQTRPPTMAAVDRVAAENGVSFAQSLNQFADRFEHNLSQNVPGASLVLRLGEGPKEVGEYLAQTYARVAGREDIAARIHNDRRQRNEFMQFIDKGNDMETLL